MFQVHSSDTPTSVSLSSALTTTTVRDWRAAAVAAYRQSERADSSALCRELAARVLELTGQPVEPGMIQLDLTTQTATVVICATWIQLRHRELRLVRPCVYCGVHRFESAAIHDLVDLGHALSVWEPRCEGCGVDDEDWTHSF